MCISNNKLKKLYKGEEYILYDKKQIFIFLKLKKSEDKVDFWIYKFNMINKGNFRVCVIKFLIAAILHEITYIWQMGNITDFRPIPYFSSFPVFWTYISFEGERNEFHNDYLKLWHEYDRISWRDGLKLEAYLLTVFVFI